MQACGRSSPGRRPPDPRLLLGTGARSCTGERKCAYLFYPALENSCRELPAGFACRDNVVDDGNVRRANTATYPEGRLQVPAALPRIESRLVRCCNGPLNIADERQAELPGNRCGEFHRLVESAPHVTPAVQRHRQQRVYVTRQPVADMQQDFGECRRILQPAMKLETPDGGIDRETVAERDDGTHEGWRVDLASSACDIVSERNAERRSTGRARILQPRQVPETAGADRVAIGRPDLSAKNAGSRDDLVQCPQRRSSHCRTSRYP